MIIERIEGSYDNVMGLPVEQVLQALDLRRADILVR
jgi:predicted house-cleaning NTP pyrophosphatase (Maf/HAM1 superfamily)